MRSEMAFPWTLVGGLMVYLHGLEAGGKTHRPTKDADVMVDVRILPGSPRQLANVLRNLDFELMTDSSTGAHRFKRGKAAVDVLAPDNVGKRADLTTVPPSQTVQVPGGRQALSRTSRVTVRQREREGEVPRPNLLGAIVVKAAAVVRLPKEKGHDRHRDDLAFLLGLVRDPFDLAKQVTKREKKLLHRASKELPDDAQAWNKAPNADTAIIALRALKGPD
jgi:hypothetical protein